MGVARPPARFGRSGRPAPLGAPGGRRGRTGGRSREGPVRVVIAGAGIGGLTTALALHRAGVEAEVFEQSAEVRELGVGVNLQPPSVRELASLGLLPALARIGVRPRRLIYLTRRGQPVWD